MNETTMEARVRVIDLLIEAALRDAEHEKVGAVAYAFTSRGRPLGAAALDEKGMARLQLAMLNDPQEVTVMVGPELRESKEQRPSIAELRRLGAEEQSLRVDPKTERAIARFDILPDIWRCWLRGLYMVRGHVVKRLGNTDLPIVDATVEIYEVDPILIILPRLPDYVIEDLRRIIIDPRGPIEQLPVIPDPLPPVEHLVPHAVQGVAHSHAMQSVAEISAPASLEFVARNASTFQLRQELALHPSILRHLLCLIHPRFVTKQLVATATTDRCGEFHAFASQGCSSDRPDLYFVVKQRVFRPLPPITIYAPTPVACYTHWNYVSGSEVTIHVTHPLAIASPPCPGTEIPTLGVVVEAIGNHSLSAIFGTSDNNPEPLTSTNLGLTHDGRPWGGMLRLRLDFDPALRDHGIRYYRVGYRKGSSGAFTDLSLPIHRTYRTYGGADPVDTVYPLGPQTVGATQNLYEIPLTLLDANTIMVIRDLTEDTIHAKFPTSAIAPGIPHTSADPDNAGKYQLCVEMFDTSGNMVDLASTGVQFYVPTADDPTAAAGLGLVSGNSFIMTLHVDNNPCFAQIDTPVDQDGDPAGTECGVIEYARDAMGNKLGTVTMQYTAAHRNGFARYSFTLFRGANVRNLPGFAGTPALPVSGAPVSPAPIIHTQPIAALLGTCDVAGFSQNLYVDALATDGLSNELGYDASAVFAFALAPEGVE